MSKWVEGKVINRRSWTSLLFSLQIEAELEPFQAGQFARLALEIDGEMVGRPYSFVNAPQQKFLEFYFILVESGPLTQRLADLQAGDSIFLAPRAAGFFTLSEVPDAHTLWLLSTGTALGPFLSMLNTETPWLRFPKIVLVHAVRTAEELTYQDEIGELLNKNPGQLQYIPFVSREQTDFAINGRVTDAIKDGRLEQRTGLTLTADNSQVMICGNPDMVRDTSLVLEERGLRKNRRKEPGHISVETYW